MTPAELIAKFEGCRLVAYPDPASDRAKHPTDASLSGDPWTIGYGATGPGIMDGTTWSQDYADDDLATRAIGAMELVLKHVLVPLNENQLAACCSLLYNIGPPAFGNSSVVRELNAGNTLAAADAFLMWDRAKGRVNPILQNRRQAERAIFLKADEQGEAA